jgi:FdhD protein
VAADTLGRVSRGRTAKVLTHRYDGAAVGRHPDQLIVEEPLEIHLDGVLVKTTKRTPGHDFELAAGFCLIEGLLAGAAVRQCKYCGTGAAVDSEFNVVSVEVLAAVPDTVTDEQRLFYAPEELAAAHRAPATGGVRSAEARP